MGREKPYNLYKRKIKLKNGKDSVVYYYSINPSSGLRSTICKSEQRKTTGCTTKYEATSYVLSRIEELKSQKARKASDLSFREYVEPFWIWETCPHVDRLRGEGKSITRNHVKIQRSVMVNHLFTDTIVSIPLSEITRDDILQFRSRLINKHGYTRTVQKAMGILKTILKEAYFREHIDRDPTVGIGKIKYEQKEAGVFSPEELRILFSDIPGVWMDLKGYCAFLLAATTGMRRGEILALQWRNIDFDQGVITIEQAWKGRGEIGPPKWNRKRIVPIPEKLLSTLSNLKDESIRIAPEDFVLCYDDGSRQGDTWWKKRFMRAMGKAGIDYKIRNLKPHSFRHTLNTILRDAGQDPAKIRAALGWQQEKVQDNYTHWQFDHLKEQARIVDDILGF